MLILILCVCSHTADLKRQEMARPGEPRPPAADRETIAIYVYYLAEQTTTGSAACWVRLSVSDPNDGGCPIRAVQAGGEPRGTGGGAPPHCSGPHGAVGGEGVLKGRGSSPFVAFHSVVVRLLVRKPGARLPPTSATSDLPGLTVTSPSCFNERVHLLQRLFPP